MYHKPPKQKHRFFLDSYWMPGTLLFIVLLSYPVLLALHIYETLAEPTEYAPPLPWYLAYIFFIPWCGASMILLFCHTLIAHYHAVREQWGQWVIQNISFVLALLLMVIYASAYYIISSTNVTQLKAGLSFIFG